jgi:DNA-directed RNA polymerase specialized sigma24 family protein
MNVRTSARAKSMSQIPKFDSYEQEADFWDTHSPEDFPGEFKQVAITFGPPPLVKRLSKRSERQEVVSLLSSLSDDERQVLALELLGFTVVEIRDILGLSPSDSQKLVRRMRRRARSLRLTAA